MKPIREMTKADIRGIKLIVFDVDGVLVPRGTKIKQEKGITTLETKTIGRKQIQQIQQLHKRGYLINISSGRGLYMLQEMFREVLPFVSLTYENGSATWIQGTVHQHINSYKHLRDIIPQIVALARTSKNVKGLEPKEFIITLHCKKRIPQVESLVKKHKALYTVWNGEAYDIGIKHKQTKALGLRHALKFFKLKKSQVMAIGDNYNDAELLAESGTAISADKSRVAGTFFVPLGKKTLPADVLMQKILTMH